MKKIWKIIAVLAIVGIIAALAGYKFIYNKPHKDFSKARPDYVMTAQNLYDEYVADEAAANLKYNEKVLQLSGVVSNVEDLDTVIRVQFIFSQGMFGDEGVRCTFDPSLYDEAKGIIVGQEISLKGYCEGKNSDVELGHCSIIK